MMFGWFKKKKSVEDITEVLSSQTESCVKDIKVKWIAFNNELAFKSDVGLDVIIDMFSQPIMQFVETKYPLLLSSGQSGEHFWMMLFTGILESNTHPKAEVNMAIEKLSLKYGGMNNG